ncbi:Gfo/Idh/MocA family oxidoreductase [Croceicoccus sp. F390]|uniref:Gfo/Idh/MocA family oxidoreductase n=1 Tax=Croceicoccus esteveae TaxID=3075597 RepID=A0ABU2ZHK6_9SPHN|nr:Gfo/Idh/MocA family oxidoreductase [Croceicoccus sp. F390]MDT0575836.1 Gfo/Idh/MocA family oxidoreductase [Croceicoccus sp. F390]
MIRPRVGFLGTGWIGRHRMEAMIATGGIDACGIVEPSADGMAQARALAPGAQAFGDLAAMLDSNPDGLVIATPSALHAEQALAVLDRGVAVFCQKPLGRNAGETRAVVAAAQRADRLLGVDMSYRLTAAAQALAGLIRDGALGEIFAVDLTFHNAYGPDKPWFYDRTQSGGGCLIDLGVHLVDLALWLLDFPQVTAAASSLHAGGRRLLPNATEVEDHAIARLDLASGASVQLACSWRLPVGSDAAIKAAFYGTKGGVTLHNIGGSFYDFGAWHHRGTHTEQVVAPPDDWGGRAAATWALRLGHDAGFDPAVWQIAETAEALDRIYAGS